MTVEEAMEVRLGQLESRVQDLSSKEEINEVLRRYCRATDRQDVEGLKSCYHPDATDRHGRVFSGKAFEFAEFIFQPTQLGGLADSRHFITNTMIEIDGERAFAESSFLCTLLLSLQDGVNVEAQSEGRYLDMFERRNETWKIRHRLMISQKMVWTRCGSQPGAILDGSAEYSFPTDQVYRKYANFDTPVADYRLEGDAWSGVREYFASSK